MHRIATPDMPVTTPARAFIHENPQSGVLLFQTFCETHKYLGVIFGESREHFAVEGDVGFLESVDEP